MSSRWRKSRKAVMASRTWRSKARPLRIWVCSLAGESASSTRKRSAVRVRLDLPKRRNTGTGLYPDWQRGVPEVHGSAGSNPARPTGVKAIHVLVDMAQTGVPVSRRPSPPEWESGMSLRPDGGAVECPASRESVPACGLKIASRNIDP